MACDWHLSVSLGCLLKGPDAIKVTVFMPLIEEVQLIRETAVKTQVKGQGRQHQFVGREAAVICDCHN